MKRSVILVGLSLLVSAGCIDFGKTENDFCATVPPEQWAAACQDKAVNPTKLMITSQALSLPVASCSGEVVVQASDDADAAVRVVNARTVNLSSVATNPVRFFSDAACTTEVTSGTIEAGLSSASFYVAGSTVGASRIVASTDGLASASQDLQIVPAAAGRPTKLGFTSGAQARTSGACSNPVTIQAQDGLGNPVTLTTAMLVDVSGSAGMTFYSDASCTSGVTQISIPVGGSSTSVYFIGTKAGAADVRVTASALPVTTQTETINPGAPTRLVFATAPLTLTAGACSGAITVQARDGFDNLSSVSASISVGLSASPSQNFTFYSQPGCTTAATRLTMTGGSSSVIFYVSGTLAALVSLTANSTGFSDGFLDVTINPGPPTNLTFLTAPQSVQYTAISGPVTLGLWDSYGNRATALAGTSIHADFSQRVELDCTPLGCGGSSYNNRDFSVAQGQNSLTFYYRSYYSVSAPTSLVISCYLLGIPANTVTQTETINP